MHKVSDFLSKHGLSSHYTNQAVFQDDAAPFPSERDIFTLRKQRGVNLGKQLSYPSTHPMTYMHRNT